MGQRKTANPSSCQWLPGSATDETHLALARGLTDADAVTFDATSWRSETFPCPRKIRRAEDCKYVGGGTSSTVSVPFPGSASSFTATPHGSIR